MIKTQRKGNWIEFSLPKGWLGKTVEDIFKQDWQAPKKLTHQYRMEKRVLVNHSAANWLTPLKPEDTLSINFFEGYEAEITPTYMDIAILYEDDHVLIVNKPAGIDTHPNEPNQDGTLLNGVSSYLQMNGESNWARHIHRLDRDTSGAILFAKHPLAAAILDGMLEQRKITRTYLALVEGRLKTKKGTIREPIGRDRHHPTRRRVSPTGQLAVTHYQLIEHLPKENLSLIKCWLETGRTHQIRVHFNHLGHPLIGDKLYGGKLIYDRQALHAVKLELCHPFTKDNIRVLEPPNDIPAIFPMITLDKI
ncbi:RluA family pseudouridine synthase [Pseudoneobacillus sp. C159]